MNDTHGHLCGDAVLKQIAARVNEMLRPEQIFARIGGEEFAVLCPETDLEGATVMAEKMRSTFQERDFECGTTPISVTCSFGVAVAETEMRRLDDLVETADRALYRAKNEGRNRVVVESGTKPS